MGVAWGVLSTARINGLVLEGARLSERLDVVAVGSRDQGRAEAFAREHQIPTAHGSYEALLEDPEVEAVYIPLPNSLHVEWSIRALEAGKHVLCEKPLAARAEDVERAFAAAESADRLLSEAFMYRHNPQTHQLLELVAEGAVGAPHLVRASFSFRLDEPENVRMLRELDGGALMDVGCYCVNGARLIAGGEPERVWGEAIDRGGVDVRFVGTMRFPGGLLASFDCGFDITPRHDLEVVGPDGSLFLADPWHAREPAIEWRKPGVVERIATVPANSYRLELEDMSDAIRKGRPPLLGRDDALGQARTIEALLRSAAERMPVALG